MSGARPGVNWFEVLQPNMNEERLINGVGSTGTHWSVTGDASDVFEPAKEYLRCTYFENQVKLGAGLMLIFFIIYFCLRDLMLLNCCCCFSSFSPLTTINKSVCPTGQ